jgi:Ni/Co efflux regulator RcnB
MKKILMTAAVVLVAGTPLAFAANYGNMGDTEPSSRHCTYQGEKWDLCREDRHKNGGDEFGDHSFGSRGGAERR